MTPANIKQFLPKSLQTQFWQDFCDGISDELNLLKSEMCSKKYLFNTLVLSSPSWDIGTTYNYFDIVYYSDGNYYISLQDSNSAQQPDQSLLYWNILNIDLLTQFKEILATFYYYPNLGIRSDLQFLKNEIDTLLFKIKRKTSYSLYDYIFRSIPFIGYVYNLYWDAYTLTKAIDYTSTNNNLVPHDFTKPFTGIVPNYYYSILQNAPFTLDADPLFNLDTNVALDSNFINETTHHLAIELAPVSLQTYNSTQYLIILSYMSYLQSMCNYNKKVTEIAHCGIQLNLICDTSGIYNNLSHGSHTVPDLLSNFATTPDYSYSGSPAQTLAKIDIGTGTLSWPTPPTPLGSVSALSNQILEKSLYLNEIADVGNYLFVNTYVLLNSISNYSLIVGDGSTYSFSGTLPYGIGIIQKSITLSYISGSTTYHYADSNQDGNLILQDAGTQYLTGTINYSTGAYSLNFYSSFSASYTPTLVPGTNYTIVSNNVGHTNIILSSFKLNFTVSGQGAQIGVTDNSGNITNTYVSPGSTITSAGILNVTFASGYTITNCSCTFQYLVYQVPDNGQPVIISYQTQENIPVTELAIKNAQNKIIAYATFPPCYLPNSNYHLSVNLFIKKS